MNITVISLLFIIPGIAAWLIGRRKGYLWRGLPAGLVFSWLGVLAIALWHPAPGEQARREEARQAAAAQARHR
jgi:hypothetical protein